MTTDFMARYRQLGRTVSAASIIHTGSWQSTDTKDNPLRATHEVQDYVFASHIPGTMQQLQEDMPVVNLPWAENHFRERVGGVPLNPPPSHKEWPWARSNAQFQNGEQGPFSHSYPERFWPRYSGYKMPSTCGEYTFVGGEMYAVHPITRQPVPPALDITKLPQAERRGVRYRYGDLDDLVHLLARDPLTRQAYLPVWFPEDTGTHHGERVPCTLGYHFMMRNGYLSCRYFMRSCDFVRHFANDVYMAARLTQWICGRVNDERPNIACTECGGRGSYYTEWSDEAEANPVMRQMVLYYPEEPDGTVEIQCQKCRQAIMPGHLRMYITSLHAFVGDVHFLKKAIES